MGFWHCDSVWSVLLLDASFVPVSYDSIKKPGRATKSRPLRTSIFNNKCTLLNCYCTLSSSALNLMLHYTYKSMLGLWRLKMASGERICWSYERSPLLGIFFCEKNTEPCWRLVKLSQSFSDTFHNSFTWHKIIKIFC